ncbi:periplasmic heavy metal sensor [Phenylobacterium sp.]|jgi:uncharacterized membrane protein|uniref:periplasmic heavy metal sensor n=1 Tax=Phenylobacterium sp. TaxID=1871053 RepID=UPI002F4192A0
MGRRGLLIVLIVSLAVNLFVIGATVGVFALGARMHLLRAGLRPAGPLWAAAADLSPERQQAFHQALRGEAGEVGGKLRAARQARRDAWLSLRSEPFDQAAAAAALDRARALEMQARGGVERRIIDFAAGLTPEERARLAERLARWGPGRRPPPQP